jgi:hypothetical protein
MSIYRISRPDDDQVVDVDSLDGVERTIASGNPGCLHVDEISHDPLPSGHTSRRWGIGIKRHDGTVAIEPDPWPCPSGEPHLPSSLRVWDDVRGTDLGRRPGRTDPPDREGTRRWLRTSRLGLQPFPANQRG